MAQARRPTANFFVIEAEAVLRESVPRTLCLARQSAQVR